jgi:uncharacterized repeat protein (TIGR03803 family)
MSRPARSIALAASLVGVLAAPPAVAGELALYTFALKADGSFPSTTVTINRGNLFGATTFGGSTGNGVVYELLPPATSAGSWTEKVLHSFAGGADGVNPSSNPIFDSSGNLYGSTGGGGTGEGTVFELVRPSSGGTWAKRVLYEFGGSGGGDPVGTLWRDRTGALYGVTFLGGGVYKLTPSAASATGYTFTLLHAFDGASDGSAPHAGVVADEAGNLYGTTSGGGPNKGSGTVYRLNRPASAKGTWTLTVLHSFGAGKDGKAPSAGLLIDSANNLYGTTTAGGTDGKGTAYQVSPPTSAGGAWGYRTLANFGGANGGAPGNGALAADSQGNLYGTSAGGGDFPFGSVFELARPSSAGETWKVSLPVKFGTKGTTGSFPQHGVTADGKGNLYGTTQSGIVFEVTP